MNDRSSQRLATRWSVPVAGLLLGVLVGICDAILLQTNFGRSQGPLGLKPYTWLVVIWTWATVGCLTGVVFASPRQGRLRGAALALTGPCLLLLGRGTTPFKALVRLSTLEVVAIWVVVSIVICAAASFVRFGTGRTRWPLAVGAPLSLLALVWLASGAQLPASGSRVAVAGKHNVALIVLDTVRHDDVVAQMPELMAFAAQAVSFENAWSPAPWTVPAHFALLTGVDPWSVPFRSVSTGFEHSGSWLGEQFRNRGYDTGAVFANPLLNEEAGFGRGFDELTVSTQSRVCRTAIGTLLGKSVLHGGPRMPLCGWLLAPDVAARATRFVERRGETYFLAMNFMDAHDPYYVRPECRPAGYRSVARSHQQLLLDALPGRTPLDPRIPDRVRAQYRLSMRCMDRALGPLLRRLDDGNTVIAVVGDHGEQFGEHGYGGHGNSLYRQVLHVPLIVKIPGLSPARVTDAVSTTDVFASLLRAAEPGRARGPIPLLDAAWRRPVLSNFDQRRHRHVEGGFSVVRGDLHFMRSLPGRELLFDYGNDPAELSPLPAADQQREIVPMRESLLHAAGRQRRRVEFDALGYLN